ncbi:MAG: hypothetical protein KIH65_001680 [Candidatus Uhrbacteria bacterium]|nr:hypothetical protein [Candidatus Uhrbacteria bacterium]
MKRFFAALGVTAVGISLFGFLPPSQVPVDREAREKWEEKERLRVVQEGQNEQASRQALLQTKANEVVSVIQYIEDTRTSPHLCFAYIWSGSPDGGPGFAHVPCEAIPPGLLTKAEVK